LSALEISIQADDPSNGDLAVLNEERISKILKQ
jgi:hypothetical protein